MNYLNGLKSFFFLGNTAYDYALFFIVTCILILTLYLFKNILLSRIKAWSLKTKTDLDDAVIEVIENIPYHFYIIVSAFFGIRYLEIPDSAMKGINIIFLVFVVFEIIRAGGYFIDYFLEKLVEKQKGNKTQSKSLFRALALIIKIGLWIVGLTLILSNLGVNVTSLITSLGIGGVAIALALQNILSDMFSAFSIYLDKPFKVGDFIVVGSDSGVVEKIGLKTTRLKTLQGEELVISNKELTTARLQNFKKMERRRVVFSVGVTYEIKSEVLKQIPGIVQNIIEKTENITFQRCFFKSYGDFSLNFEISYFVENGDYDEYTRVSQEVLFKVFDAFEKHSIDFAYPTQTVYVNK